MEKWWKVPKGCELTAEQEVKVVNMIMAWISRQVELGIW
jgi:uncharacterized protein YeaC (DUF1315 family)